MISLHGEGRPWYKWGPGQLAHLVIASRSLGQVHDNATRNYHPLATTLELLSTLDDC